MRTARQKGFTLITAALAVIGLIGATGLAVDVGRMYISKNEVQTFCDSAALSACRRLNGTWAGVGRALDEVENNVNRWNLGSATVAAPVVRFSVDGANYVDAPSPIPVAGNIGYRYVQVRAQVNLGLLFMPAVVNRGTQGITAVAAAGQEPAGSFPGVAPFSPIAFNASPPSFGFAIGQQYAIRYPNKAYPAATSAPNKQNMCAGDDSIARANMINNLPNQIRGYIEENSASEIEEAIHDGLDKPLKINQLLHMSPGAKEKERKSIQDRVRGDATDGTFEDYILDEHRNQRRVIVCPINSGSPDFRVLGFGMFLLGKENDYNNKGGDESWCATYIGPASNALDGSAGGAGASTYVVRLVQ